MPQLRPALTIRPVRRGDHDALIALHTQAFHARGANRHQAWTQIRQDTLVALHEGEPVGFGCWEIAGKRRREPELDDLLACLEPMTRAILAPASAPDVPLPLRIEAPPEVHPVQRPRDTVFTALAVRPDHRRSGVGTALAKARIDRARRHRSHSIFVHCVAGSGSRELYASLGFQPLVSKDAHYRDGTGMTLMWLGLR